MLQAVYLVKSQSSLPILLQSFAVLFIVFGVTDKQVKMTNEEVLILKTRDGITIKNYLISLLIALWREGEGFSGKRPFGNSDWQYDLYYPLAEAGLIKSKFDGSYLEEFDQDHADKLILELINSL